MAFFWQIDCAAYFSSSVSSFCILKKQHHFSVKKPVLFVGFLCIPYNFPGSWIEKLRIVKFVGLLYCGFVSNRTTYFPLVHQSSNNTDWYSQWFIDTSHWFIFAAKSMHDEMRWGLSGTQRLTDFLYTDTNYMRKKLGQSILTLI